MSPVHALECFAIRGFFVVVELNPENLSYQGAGSGSGLCFWYDLIVTNGILWVSSVAQTFCLDNRSFSFFFPYVWLYSCKRSAYIEST